MLQPKKRKYNKEFRGRTKGKAYSGNTLSFGRYGLKAISMGEISAREIEAARKAINRHRKRVGKLWIRVFPHTPVTKKPADTRMGKGKGSVDYWAAKIKPGVMLFELDGIPSELAKESLARAAAKISVKTKFISNELA